MLAWVEAATGGRVVRVERQPRWRPAWFLDVDIDGTVVPLYFRGDRGSLDHGVYPLEHEYRALGVLHEYGIPVPRLYGFCDAPRGMLLERMPGRANLLTETDDDLRTAALDDYIGWLARMHGLDTAPFEAAGLAPASADPAMADFPKWEATYRSKKLRPEPLIEFVIGWLKRNRPTAVRPAAFVSGDSGQFLFDQGKVTAVIDLELCFLGDPAHDLACMRLRDLAEPLGDLRPALRRYEQAIGEPLDDALVDFHTVRFAICTPMSVAHVVAAPPPDVDLVRYLVWYVQFGRVALEVIAARLGITLPAPSLTSAVVSRHSVGYGALAAALHDVAPPDSQQQFRLDVAMRLTDYLRRAEAVGSAHDGADLDVAAHLLGRRPSSWQEADASLEDFVAEYGASHERELVVLFHQRMVRWNELLQIGMTGRGYSVQPLR